MLASPLIPRDRRDALITGLGLGLLVVATTTMPVADHTVLHASEHYQVAWWEASRDATSTPGGPLPPVMPADAPPPELAPGERAAGTTAMLVDRSRDRRADLADMAIAIRWHRGTASGLPPGAD
jgi:hypothetical protein